MRAYVWKLRRTANATHQYHTARSWRDGIHSSAGCSKFQTVLEVVQSLNRDVAGEARQKSLWATDRERWESLRAGGTKMEACRRTRGCGWARLDNQLAAHRRLYGSEVSATAKW